MRRSSPASIRPTAINRDRGRPGRAEALEPFDRQSGESPYEIQHALQSTMQDLVGIVRREDEMHRALTLILQLQGRAARVAVTGNREYNPGWHTALDLHNLLTVAEAITRSAIDRRESRGGHFRDDYPQKDKQPAASTWSSDKALTAHAAQPRADRAHAARLQASSRRWDD